MKFKGIEGVKEACEKEGKKYLVYGNKVLDVAKFDHPGPANLITDNIGKDATKLFDDQGHSPNAHEMMKNITVGHINNHKLLENPDVAVLPKEEQEIHDKLDEMIDVKKPLIP